jgi:hypothetical protein
MSNLDEMNEMLKKVDSMNMEERHSYMHEVLQQSMNNIFSDAPAQKEESKNRKALDDIDAALNSLLD